MHLSFARRTLLALLLGTVSTGFVTADTFTISTPDSQSRGWFNESDFHPVGNDNYLVGDAGSGPGQTVRNFFVFDLSAIPSDQVITSAVLLLYNPPGSYFSQDPSEDYVIFSLDTLTVSALRTGGTQPGAFADLGSGTAYSSPIAISSQSNGADVVVPLNLDFISYAQANKSGLVGFGGALTTLDPATAESVFGFTGTNAGVALSQTRLVVTTVPEPAPALLMLVGGAVCALAKRLLRRRS